jgi:aminoglycoside phosphotransferase (APT) family kinase protein
MIDAEVPAGIHAAPVTAWFEEHIDGVVPPLRFERVAGGHSCLTYVVADLAGQRYVLRRPPLGHTLATAHDVAREHKIISALAPTPVPVAPALGLCTDPSVNDAPFYIMGYVDGVVLHDATAARTLTLAARRRAAEHLVEILVALHEVDVDRVGLGDLSKRTDYLGRQLRRWSAQWENSKTRELPGMERLQAWLVDHQPPDPEARIVHGDFRLGNCIHSPDGSILAMLDWELCTLGDPMADVSYLLRSWASPDEPPRAGTDPASRANGFPSREEMAARYSELSGTSLDDLAYWMAFNAWRSACIVQGVYARYINGVMGAAGDTEEVRRFGESVVEGMHAGLAAAGLDDD